jgi:hypothetical protein
MHSFFILASLIPLCAQKEEAQDSPSTQTSKGGPIILNAGSSGTVNQGSAQNVHTYDYSPWYIYAPYAPTNQGIYPYPYPYSPPPRPYYGYY